MYDDKFLVWVITVRPAVSYFDIKQHIGHDTISL